MRHVFWMLFICLLIPVISHAQEDVPAPIIAQLPYNGRNDIYALQPEEASQLLTEANQHEMFISPDSRKIAYLNLPPFAVRQLQIEPGYYPSDLLVLDLETSTVTPLVAHGDTEPDTSIYSGPGAGPSVVTPGEWANPRTNMFGSRLYANVAWSPDSRFIAHLQSVPGEDYLHPTTRLVTFDVETGEERLIAEFENGIVDEETGFAAFWFDVGIVLFRYPPEGSSTVFVYTPLGELLHTWEVEAWKVLLHENPIRYKGKDYLQFIQWQLYDVSTGTESYVPGTLALVSAANPDESLVMEACADTSSLKVMWDVYTPDNKKVLELTDVDSPVLSPDGQQIAYITQERTLMLFEGKDPFPYQDDAGKPFQSLDPRWGAMIYTLTDVGTQDCGRMPKG